MDPMACRRCCNLLKIQALRQSVRPHEIKRLCHSCNKPSKSGSSNCSMASHDSLRTCEKGRERERESERERERERDSATFNDTIHTQGDTRDQSLSPVTL